jgi:hypothetical protein
MLIPRSFFGNDSRSDLGDMTQKANSTVTGMQILRKKAGKPGEATS